MYRNEVTRARFRASAAEGMLDARPSPTSRWLYLEDFRDKPRWRGIPKLIMLVAAAIASFIPAACAPPRQVVDASGPVVDASENSGSQFSRFKDLWGKARDSSNDAISAGTESLPIVTKNMNSALLNAGLALVYNNCSDFFEKKGRQQQSIIFVRDSNGVIAPMVTGALGLVSGAGIAIPLVGLAAGGLNSGINVVASDFLFGAENVDDVRVLTLNALSAHQSTVLALQTKYPSLANFDWVTTQIMDHQSICQPPRILALSKEAIKKGNICAYTTASSASQSGNSTGSNEASSNGTGAGQSASARKANQQAKTVKSGGQSAGTGQQATGSAAPKSPLSARVGVQVQTSCDETTSPTSNPSE